MSSQLNIVHFDWKWFCGGQRSFPHQDLYTSRELLRNGGFSTEGAQTQGIQGKQGTRKGVQRLGGLRGSTCSSELTDWVLTFVKMEEDLFFQITCGPTAQVFTLSSATNFVLAVHPNARKGEIWETPEMCAKGLVFGCFFSPAVWIQLCLEGLKLSVCRAGGGGRTVAAELNLCPAAAMLKSAVSNE